jgi:hypothetical protein
MPVIVYDCLTEQTARIEAAAETWQTDFSQFESSENHFCEPKRQFLRVSAVAQEGYS